MDPVQKQVHHYWIAVPITRGFTGCLLPPQEDQGTDDEYTLRSARELSEFQRLVKREAGAGDPTVKLSHSLSAKSDSKSKDGPAAQSASDRSGRLGEDELSEGKAVVDRSARQDHGWACSNASHITDLVGWPPERASQSPSGSERASSGAAAAAATTGVVPAAESSHVASGSAWHGGSRSTRIDFRSHMLVVKAGMVHIRGVLMECPPSRVEAAAQQGGKGKEKGKEKEKGTGAGTGIEGTSGEREAAPPITEAEAPPSGTTSTAPRFTEASQAALSIGTDGTPRPPSAFVTQHGAPVPLLRRRSVERMLVRRTPPGEEGGATGSSAGATSPEGASQSGGEHAYRPPRAVRVLWERDHGQKNPRGFHAVVVPRADCIVCFDQLRDGGPGQEVPRGLAPSGSRAQGDAAGMKVHKGNADIAAPWAREVAVPLHHTRSDVDISFREIRDSPAAVGVGVRGSGLAKAGERKGAGAGAGGGEVHRGAVGGLQVGAGGMATGVPAAIRESTGVVDPDVDDDDDDGGSSTGRVSGVWMEESHQGREGGRSDSRVSSSVARMASKEQVLDEEVLRGMSGLSFLSRD